MKKLRQSVSATARWEAERKAAAQLPLVSDLDFDNPRQLQEAALHSSSSPFVLNSHCTYLGIASTSPSTSPSTYALGGAARPFLLEIDLLRVLYVPFE